jgi:hypothetical protein
VRIGRSVLPRRSSAMSDRSPTTPRPSSSALSRFFPEATATNVTDSHTDSLYGNK